MFATLHCNLIGAHCTMRGDSDYVPNRPDPLSSLVSGAGSQDYELSLPLIQEVSEGGAPNSTLPLSCPHLVWGKIAQHRGVANERLCVEESKRGGRRWEEK